MSTRTPRPRRRKRVVSQARPPRPSKPPPEPVMPLEPVGIHPVLRGTSQPLLPAGGRPPPPAADAPVPLPPPRPPATTSRPRTEEPLTALARGLFAPPVCSAAPLPPGPFGSLPAPTAPLVEPAPDPLLPPELRPSREQDSADCFGKAFGDGMERFLQHHQQGQARQVALLGQNARVVSQANADLLRLQQVFLSALPGGTRGR